MSMARMRPSTSGSQVGYTSVVPSGDRVGSWIANSDAAIRCGASVPFVPTTQNATFSPSPMASVTMS